ncbi:hypothetical protein GE09DRAFT_1084962 [Coniochaeta sp. 2T2.1]|nr:hypothetical protein GE09DRAFT_1084962 [Coniochaeta sp. 2T2.1]
MSLLFGGFLLSSPLLFVSRTFWFLLKIEDPRTLTVQRRRRREGETNTSCLSADLGLPPSSFSRTCSVAVKALHNVLPETEQDGEATSGFKTWLRHGC